MEIPDAIVASTLIAGMAHVLGKFAEAATMVVDRRQREEVLEDTKECNICGDVFKSPKHMAQHRKDKHGR